MKMLSQQKVSAVTAFRRLAVAASLGLVVLTSQVSHAASTVKSGSEFRGGAESGIDLDIIEDAELTDLSIHLKLSPYVFRGKNSRQFRKRFNHTPRKSYSSRYPYSRKYSRQYNSYDRYGRPIYRDNRRKSGSGLRHNFRRH